MEAQDYVRGIKAKGLTQAQIEEKTGIPQPTISKIERGEVKDVMSKTYRAIKALYDELYGDPCSGESLRTPSNNPGERAADRGEA